MTTDSKLTEILKGYEPNFYGVYLYDDLPKLDLRAIKGKVFLLNYVTHKEVEEGKIGHFVTFDFRDKLKGYDNWIGPYYFGPYGVKPDKARNIMQLPNPKYATKLLDDYDKLHGTTYKVNNVDFQAWKPWDDTCGLYSSLYVVNPNFNTNPVFYGGQNRTNLDHKLVNLFTNLGVIGNPFTQPKLKASREALKDLATKQSYETRKAFGKLIS